MLSLALLTHRHQCWAFIYSESIRRPQALAERTEGSSSLSVFGDDRYPALSCPSGSYTTPSLTLSIWSNPLAMLGFSNPAECLRTLRRKALKTTDILSLQTVMLQTLHWVVISSSSFSRKIVGRNLLERGNILKHTKQKKCWLNIFDLSSMLLGENFSLEKELSETQENSYLT